MGIVFCGLVGFFSCLSFFLFLCPLVELSCIPLVYLWFPLVALLMNIFAFTHQKNMCILSWERLELHRWMNYLR